MFNNDVAPSDELDSTGVHNDQVGNRILHPECPDEHEVLCLLWDHVYADDITGMDACSAIARIGGAIIASCRVTQELVRHACSREYCGPDWLSLRVSELADLVRVGVGADELKSHGEALAALVVCPQALSYVLPRLPLTVASGFSARICDTFDSLPDDQITFDLVARITGGFHGDSYPVRAGASWLSLLLRHEVGFEGVLDPAGVLLKADELFESYADPASLFSWMALPARWRFYILRDSLVDGESCVSQIQDERAGPADIVAQLGPKVCFICQSLCREPMPMHGDEAPLPEISLRWYLRIVEKTGILLLPRSDFELSGLSELREVCHTRNEESKRKVCNRLIATTSSDSVLPRYNASQRLRAVACLRGLVQARAPEDDLGCEIPHDAPQILGELPIRVFVKDGAGNFIYRNERLKVDSTRTAVGAAENAADLAHDIAALCGDNAESRIRTVRIDGKTRHFASVKRPIGSLDNEHRYVLGCEFDVTPLVVDRNRHEAAVNAAGIGLWVRGINTKTAWFSSRWKEMLGYSHEEIPNKFSSWIDLLDARDQDRVIKCLEDYIDGRRSSYDVEFRMRHKSGRTVWIRSIGSIVCDNGKPAYIAGVHLDVTDYKLKGLFEGEAIDLMTNVYVFAKNENLQFTFANNALADSLGLRKDQILGLKDYDLFADERAVKFFTETDEKVLASAYQKIMGATVPVKTRLAIEEEYFDDINGERRWLATIKQPVFMPDGSLQLLGIAMDITELRQLRKKCELQHMYLNALASETNDTLYFKDRNGQFVNVSESFALAVKSSPKAIETMTDFDLFPPEFAEEWAREERRIFETGGAVIDSCRMVFADGDQPRIRVVSKLPVRDPEGQIRGILGYGKDVTKLVDEMDQLWLRIIRVAGFINKHEDAVFVKDLLGRYVAFNETFMRFHGSLSREELVGKTDYNFWPREQADQLRRDDRLVLTSGVSRDPYVEALRAKGSVQRVLLTTKLPLFIASSDKPAAILGVYADITEMVSSADLEWKTDVRARLPETAARVKKVWIG